MHSKANTVRISVLVCVEHINHAVTVDVGEVEDTADAVRLLLARHQAEGAKSRHIIDELILLLLLFLEPLAPTK